MHINEGRMSQQLEMKFGVLENAINKLIGIVSSLTLENQKLQRRIEQVARAQAQHNGTSESETKGDEYDLDIAQVQKILKQQAPPQQGLGRRIINN